jgi:hypothetical protein
MPLFPSDSRTLTHFPDSNLDRHLTSDSGCNRQRSFVQLLKGYAMAQEWFFLCNGAEIGPVTAQQLKDMAAVGKLTPDDLVRRRDLPTPMKAGSIKGLFPPAAAVVIPQPPPATAFPPMELPDEEVPEEQVRRRSGNRKKTGGEWWKSLSSTGKIGVALGGGMVALMFLCCGGFALMSGDKGDSNGGRGDSNGGKVTKANYDKVKDGMTISEVERILGKGTEQASSNTGGGNLQMSGKVMIWQDGMKSISITFVNDKVMVKAQFGLKD